MEQGGAERKRTGILAGEENSGWDKEVEIGKEQGMKAKNEDANVLGGGRQGDELRNPGGKGEQWKVSGGVGRKRTENESHEGGSERTATKQQEQDKRDAKKGDTGTREQK